MSKTQSLSFEEWSSVIRYEPDTGKFFRIKRRGPYPSGEAKGTINNQGYVVISLSRRPTLAHRIAWLLMTGAWPAEQIDHINRCRTDNRWVNLRAATYAQNSANSINPKSRLLPTGVTRIHDSAPKPFRAAISVSNKDIYLGCFSSPEEAHAAYLDAKRKYHKEFSPY